MIKIPLHNLPAFSQRVNLDDREYELEFQWLNRLGYFVLNIFDNEQKAIAVGVKLQKDWPLLCRAKLSGQLILSGDGEPDPSNLKNFELLYVDQ